MSIKRISNTGLTGVKYTVFNAGNTPISDVPDAPTIGTATAGTGLATVTYTAAATGGAATTFTATSSPESLTGSSSSSPITVSGLTAGTAYTFTVVASNSTGSSPASGASNSVTPTASTSYESIATVTVTGSSTDTISFTSIPSTFTHLQLRITQQTSAYDVWNIIEFNNDTTASNYWSHRIFGTGSGAAESQSGNNNYVFYQAVSGHSTTSMTGQVIDILDYKNTNKNKVVRHLSGLDNNGSGFLWFGSVGWNSTAAVNRLDIKLLNPGGKTYTADSKFALYGIKGA
jgi:hypothetical protein